MRPLLPVLLCAAWVAGCQTGPSNAPVSERRIDATEASAPSRSALPPNSGAAAKSEEAGARKATDKDWRPDVYTVKRGDTLYAIALDHGLDYRDLATWNGLADPNRIRAGQTLRLHAPAVAAAPVLEPEPQSVVVEAKPLDARAQPNGVALPASVALKTEPKAEKLPYSDEAAARVLGNDGTPPAQQNESLITSVRPGPGAAGTQGSSPAPATASVPVPAPAGSASRPAATPASTPVPASTAGSTTVPGSASAPLSSSAPSSVTGVPSTSGPATSSSTTAASGAASTSAAAPATAPSSLSAPTLDKESAFDADRWTWPARGEVTAAFDGSRSKGITIAGRQGEPVVAANAGKVVYVGNAIQAYGHLAIVKHGAEFLTVYAHNAVILVKEGQLVAAGQKIAEMGARPGGPTALHFEVRKLGQPVDPTKVLPTR